MILSGFFLNIFKVATGGTAAQVLTILTLPVLTRLYLPTAYSAWALLISIVVILTSVATLRYELAVVLPATHEEAANLAIASVLVTVVVSFCSGIMLFSAGHWFLGDAYYEELQAWLWFMPLLILATGVYQICNAWCVRTGEFGWYSISQAGLPFFTVLSQITAAVLGHRTSAGLIQGTLAGQILIVSILVIVIYRKYGSLLNQCGCVRKMWDALRAYRVYPLYMTPYTLVGTIRERLVYFLLSSIGVNADMGFYNLSSRIVNMPNSFVSTAVRPVFFQYATSNDFRLMEKPVNQALLLLSVCVIPFWVLFLFHAEDLFGFVFGEAWRGAGILAAILSVPAVPLLLGNWLDRAFDALGRQRLAFTLELIFSIFSVAFLAGGFFLFHVVAIAVGLQSLILTFYYSFWIVVLFRISQYRLSSLRRLFLVVIIIGILSAAISWFFSLVFPILQAILITGLVFMAGIGMYIIRQCKLLKKERLTV